jgi:hypothetical protein
MINILYHEFGKEEANLKPNGNFGMKTPSNLWERLNFGKTSTKKILMSC